MYMTNYFANVDIDSIINICNNCLTNLNNIKDSTLARDVNNDNWVSSAATKLSSAFNDNTNNINTVIKSINSYISALNSAKVVKEKQNKMTEILNSMKNLEVQMNSEPDYGKKILKYNDISTLYTMLEALYIEINNELGKIHTAISQI